MNNLVKIGNGTVIPKQYHGKRVVTFAEIDTCHARPEGTARKRFNDNQKHFIEGTDFFKVCASEIRTHKIMPLSSKAHEDITFITESGYLMLAKSFTDDLAWDVQRELVSYFEYGKNADKPSTSHTALKQRLLSSVNHEAELLRKSFEAAGIDPKFTAVHLANLYRAEVGQNIPALPIEVETTYDRTEIAKQLGVMTKSGSPHKDAIGAIIRKIGVDKSQIIHSSFSQNGHDGGYDRFKAPVLDKVRKWLDTAGWPNPIVLDKKYNVVYRSR